MHAGSHVRVTLQFMTKRLLCQQGLELNCGLIAIISTEAHWWIHTRGT